MNTVTTWQTSSTSSEDTCALAAKLGRKLKGGEVFDLHSDLGGGKTRFVQGLAEGLEIKEAVTSPTFMVERVYDGRLPLHHFDFYRLGEAGVVGEELREVLDDDRAVTAIEWGDVVTGVLPDDRISVTIERTGDDSRDFKFRYPEHRAYLFEELV
jgi:tRNA threonylcarbamoyladenosine biosynthesis protein TsaE